MEKTRFGRGERKKLVDELVGSIIHEDTKTSSRIAKKLGIKKVTLASIQNGRKALPVVLTIGGSNFKVKKKKNVLILQKKKG